MNQITVIESIKPSKVCKTYSKNAAGKIEKNAIANVIEGKAITERVNTAQEMATLLDYVTAKDNFVLCAGTWRGAPADEFTLIAEADLAKRLGRQIGDEQLAGVHEINGEFVAARLKRSIEPSNWILLDADNPPGIPPEWAAMTIAERLELWEPLLPGITQCERIELRGSSARVINGSGSHKATHAWIRVSDPSKIALMKAHLGIEMVNKGLSFPFKKQSRLEPGRVVGIESRSVFDLAVFDTGRLVFCAKPEVQIKGHHADSAGVVIINEGSTALDIGWIKQPGLAALNQYKEKTGIQLDLQVKNGFLSVRSNGQLTMDCEITSKGNTKPLSDWVSGLKPGDKLRCESPFRESVSEAAFIKIGEDGQPFIYDVGNGTAYHLQGAVKAPATAYDPDIVEPLETIEATEYILDYVISAGLVILAAAPGAGKTTALVAIAMRAAGLIRDSFEPTIRRNVIIFTEHATQIEEIITAMVDAGVADCSYAQARSRIIIANAKRMAVETITECAAFVDKGSYGVVNERGSKRFTASPWVVFDTTNANFDLENENDSQAVGKMMAKIKTEFFIKRKIPTLLSGHTAKTLKHGDGSTLSARGSGAVEGDAHQVLYVTTDEHTGARYLEIKAPKHRFHAAVDSINLVGGVQVISAIDVFGDKVSYPVSFVAAFEATTSEQKRDDKERAQAIAKENRSTYTTNAIRGQLLDCLRDWPSILQSLADAVIPTKNNIVPKCNFQRDAILKVFDALLAEGHIISREITAENREEYKRIMGKPLHQNIKNYYWQKNRECGFFA